MSEAEKITMVQTLCSNDAEATAAVAAVYLSIAKNAIVKRRYPFGDGTEEMPTVYDYLQCQLAARMFLRRGAEGETGHNENGVNRTYGSANDEDLLGEVVPLARVGGVVSEA